MYNQGELLEDELAMLHRGIFIIKEPTISLLPNTPWHELPRFSLSVLLPFLASATQEPQLQSASNNFSQRNIWKTNARWILQGFFNLSEAELTWVGLKDQMTLPQHCSCIQSILQEQPVENCLLHLTLGFPYPTKSRVGCLGPN
jgi:hypothetical protein